MTKFARIDKGWPIYYILENSKITIAIQKNDGSFC